MLLRQFLAEYVSCRDLCAASVEQLSCFVNRLESWRGVPLSVADLTHETINDYLFAARNAGLSADTRRNRRRMFLTLANHAAEDGLIPHVRTRKVKPIMLPQRTPLAWTADHARRLLAACGRLSGQHAATGVSRTLFWRAYVMSAWDTGLRGCDLRRLSMADVLSSDGRLPFVQTKTGKRVVVHFRDATLQAIERSAPPVRPLCFPLWGRLELFRREARRLVRLAGLPGSLKCLRSGSGTAVERQARGRGHEHLGNTRQVFERNYLDERQIEDDRPLPPRLD